MKTLYLIKIDVGSIIMGILSLSFLFFISVVIVVFIKVIIKAINNLPREKNQSENLTSKLDRPKKKQVKTGITKSVEIDPNEIDKIFINRN